MDSCGLWVDDFDGSSIAPGCNRNCKAEIVKQGRTEWWVQIRTREARTPRQIHGDFSKPFFLQPQPIGLNAIKNKYANHSAWKRHRRKPKSASPGLDWPLGTEEHEHTALARVKLTSIGSLERKVNSCPRFILESRSPLAQSLP